MTYCLACKKEWTHTNLNLVLESGNCCYCGASRKEEFRKRGWKYHG